MEIVCASYGAAIKTVVPGQDVDTGDRAGSTVQLTVPLPTLAGEAPLLHAPVPRRSGGIGGFGGGVALWIGPPEEVERDQLARQAAPWRVVCGGCGSHRADLDRQQLVGLLRDAQAAGQRRVPL